MYLIWEYVFERKFKCSLGVMFGRELGGCFLLYPMPDIISILIRNVRENNKVFFLSSTMWIHIIDNELDLHAHGVKLGIHHH